MSFKPALFIYFDGSYNINTKNGSIGFCIKTQGGDILDKENRYIRDIDSNTESEYLALKMSLEYVLKKYNSDNRLFIFGDEKTIINQLKNKQNNEQSLKYDNYISDINNLLRKFNSIVLKNIPQHENKIAHNLSNSLINN